MAHSQQVEQPAVRQDEPRKEMAQWSAGLEIQAVPPRFEVAEAVRSRARQQGAAVWAVQASEAQALTQRISRRWIEKSHDRRHQDAIEFRCAEQDAR